MRDQHVLAVVEAATGGCVDPTAEVAADQAGYREALRLAGEAPGWRVWALEGWRLRRRVDPVLLAQGERV